MSTPFYVYELGTGKILRSGNTPASMTDLQAGVGEGVVGGIIANDRDHKHDLSTNSKVDKTIIGYTLNKTSITADGSDTAAFTSLPTDALLTVLGETETEVGGAINFSVDLAGTYTLLFTHPIHLDTEVVITAT